MPFAPVPVSRYLVPGIPIVAPEGFTPVDEKILNGLPHTIALDRATELIVSVPNGLAVTWRDGDPMTLVSRSDEEITPSTPSPDEPLGNVGRAPVRLLVRFGGVLASSLPLAAGLRRAASDAGEEDRGVQIEFVVLSWELHAGTLRGPGDFGSRISLAWRRADRGGAHFSPPPVHVYLLPRLLPRLSANFRIESTLGLMKPFPLVRFERKKVFWL